MEIIGHSQLINDLKNLAERGSLSHAYAFWGSERVGKRTVAQSFAHYLETKTFSPPSAHTVLFDCLLIEPDEERTIGIDAVRRIRHFLGQRPVKSSYRTVIIDGGHAVTREAQNALLKISESPPPSALLIIIVKHFEMLQTTLHSRLQKIYFAPVPRAVIQKWLIKVWNCPPARAELLSSRSFHQPGRAHALLHDKDFQEKEHQARTFIGLSAGRSGDFIKKLVARDDFHMEEFVDLLIAEIALKKDFRLWHRLMDVRRQTDYFNVNPRLQLQALKAQM